MKTYLNEQPGNTELNLSSKRLDDSDIIKIVPDLKKDTTTTTLSLRNNRITDKGIIALATALTENTTLKEIDLSSNYIQEKGIQSLASALKKNTTLETLTLDSIWVNSHGLKYLTDSLKTNITLKYFYLDNNHFGDEGARVIASLLEVNTGLETLDIASNKITDLGIIALATALEENATLRCLSLGDNKIDDAGAQALADALTKNTQLTTLFLHAIQITPHGVAVFAKAMEINYTVIMILGLEEFPHIRTLIIRNCSIHAILPPLRQMEFNLGRISNHKLKASIDRLKSLVPNLDSLPDNSFPQEIFRLLKVLISLKEKHIIDQELLSQPFEDKEIQSIANHILTVNPDSLKDSETASSESFEEVQDLNSVAEPEKGVQTSPTLQPIPGFESENRDDEFDFWNPSFNMIILALCIPIAGWIYLLAVLFNGCCATDIVEEDFGQNTGIRM